MSNRIEKFIVQIVNAEKQIEKMKAEVAQTRKLLYEEMEKEDVNNYEVTISDMNNVYMIASRVDRLNVEYYLDKLKENLSSELISEITEKTYAIKDMQGLVSLLKAHGVNAKSFKSFVNSAESVNREAIKQLYAVGKISKEKLRGCYKATVSKHVQIRKKG